MARLSGNDKIPSRYFGDSPQLKNLILDQVSIFNITPHVQDFILGLLDNTDKNIEVADGHHFTVKQKGQVQIKMCDDNGDTFIATFHNVTLAPDLCDRLF